MTMYQANPLFWSHFSISKTSKTSKWRDALVQTFASVTIPKNRTSRDAIEHIAGYCGIPVEYIATDLERPVYSRAQTFYGFAGDLFDGVAKNYQNVKWWVSDIGLKMAVVEGPAPRLASFEELMPLEEPTFPIRTPASADRGEVRSTWLEQQMARKGWTTYADIAAHGGPSYNTIRRYGSGKPSNQDRTVRAVLAKAFGCDNADVPE
jgi:hypothetical protein